MASDFIKYDKSVKRDIAHLLSLGNKASNAGTEVDLIGEANLPAAKQFVNMEKSIKKVLGSLGEAIIKDTTDASNAFASFESADSRAGQSFKE